MWHWLCFFLFIDRSIAIRTLFLSLGTRQQRLVFYSFLFQKGAHHNCLCGKFQSTYRVTAYRPLYTASSFLELGYRTFFFSETLKKTPTQIAFLLHLPGCAVFSSLFCRWKVQVCCCFWRFNTGHQRGSELWHYIMLINCTSLAFFFFFFIICTTLFWVLWFLPGRINPYLDSSGGVVGQYFIEDRESEKWKNECAQENHQSETAEICETVWVEWILYA